MINIKELVKDNKQVHFAFYKDGELWYRAADGFLFPVPISDVGGATMLACDKALLFMRYMRKHAETLEAAKTEL